MWLVVKCCVVQLYSLQLDPEQTWQTWPASVNLVQFMNGGRSSVVLVLTISTLMSDMRQTMSDADAEINDAYTSLTDSMLVLRSASADYSSSVVISESFVKSVLLRTVGLQF